jgi:hypothetical protein
VHLALQKDRLAIMFSRQSRDWQGNVTMTHKAWTFLRLAPETVMSGTRRIAALKYVHAAPTVRSGVDVFHSCILYDIAMTA